MPKAIRTTKPPADAADTKGRMFQGRFYSHESVKAWGKKPRARTTHPHQRAQATEE